MAAAGTSSSYFEFGAFQVQPPEGGHLAGVVQPGAQVLGQPQVVLGVPSTSCSLAAIEFA